MQDQALLRLWAALATQQRPPSLPPQPKPHSFTYVTYLRSNQWRAKSRACVERAGRKCERCGAKQSTPGVTLQAHHKHYLTFQNERPEDLQCLCVPCHEKADAIRRIKAKRRRR